MAIIRLQTELEKRIQILWLQLLLATHLFWFFCHIAQMSKSDRKISDSVHNQKEADVQDERLKYNLGMTIL